jgi:multidrug resistance protein
MGFGIIVPLMYAYGKGFGLTGQTLGFLTAAFSIAQFFATPVLGSLSDRYGRKPLLAISLLGTCISFIMFAQARSIIMLFAARILDGITGGNISVAQAMISDTSTPQNRAKRFGILSSAFGFGFIIGPVVGGFLSPFGIKVPFYFAAAIAMIGTLCTVFLLKETNPKGTKKIKTRFSFMALIHVLKMRTIGTAIFIGFLLTLGQFTMIIGFQTLTIDILKLNTTQNSLLYAGFAVTGILAQLGLSFFNKVMPSKASILLVSTLFCLAAMFASGFMSGLITFTICIFIYGFFNGLRNPMLNAIIADHNNTERKGEVMGVNQSYISIGQTLGPVTAGLVTCISVHSVFWLSSLFILIAFLFSFRLKTRESF